MISKISSNDKYLEITWNDSSVSKIKKADLRNNCPCAECATEREKRGLKYIPIFSDEQLTITDIQLVGSYAVLIKWKDGHSNGIYDFNFLKRIIKQILL